MKPTPISCLLLSLLLSSCGLVTKIERPVEGEDVVSEGAVQGGLMDPTQADSLLSMTYAEALLISAQSMVLPPHFRVAADSIEHPPAVDDALQSFTATGRVFMEIEYLEPLVSFSGKAEVSEIGVVLSDRPMLRRGYSIVEATSDETVFRVKGEVLEINGPHRVRSFGERPGEGPSDENEFFEEDLGFDPSSLRDI